MSSGQKEQSSTSVNARLHDDDNDEGRFDYDLIVIGGGSGGLRCAKESADLGAHVALLDYVKPSPQGTTWGIGGTCVNVGCIPKKQMHYSAVVASKIFQESYMYGWDIVKDIEINEESNPFHHIHGKDRLKHFNWKRLVKGLVDTRRGSNFVYKNELRSKKIRYYNALGCLLDAHTVQVIDPKNPLKEECIRSRYIVIASGGRPHLPNHVEGVLQHGVTSDDIFTLKKPPGKTLVVGGSYIALETAGFLAAFGYDVTIMVRSVVLRHKSFDREVVNRLQTCMSTYHDIKFLQPFVSIKIEKDPTSERKRVYFQNVETKELGSDLFDTVMFATGRAADTLGLNLDAVGVKYTEHGKIIVDDEERTSVPNIFALGDIIQNGFNYELTPIAIQQGTLLSWRLFGKDATNLLYLKQRRVDASRKVEYHLVPTTVFTPLEYGLVGYSEQWAVEEFGKQNIMIYHKLINLLHNKIPNLEEKGFVKLICKEEEEDEVVIGFHYLGPDAAEVTQGFALALKKKATKEDFDNLIGIHPSNAESFVYLQEGVYEDKSCCG